MPDQELKQRIEQAVEEHREEIVQALCELLKFKTVSGSGDEEGEALYRDETARCLQFLEAEAGRMGLQWRSYDNRLAVMELPGGEQVIGLPVHVDVVPPGEGWTHGPFDGVVADETVWGRGCQDDKGPVIQTVWATNIVKELGLPLKRGIKVIIGTKEECGDWADIKHYFDVEPAPEMSIVSDAGFPIINGEKGMLNLEMRADIAQDEAPAVGGFRLESVYAGERANIVPPKAELVFAGDAQSESSLLQRELDRFLKKHPDARAELGPNSTANSRTITFHGKGAHGSTPEEGHNAALDLLLFMTQSGFVSDDEADLAQFLHECGADHTGKRLGIDAKHDFIGATTVNLGKLRWSDGRAEATFNIRNTMGQSIAETVGKATEVINDFGDETGFDVEAEPSGRTMEPIYVDPEQHPEFIGVLKDAYTVFTGRDATLHAIGGTTYAKVFPNAVCFGPVDLAEEQELAHQTDERVKIEHLLRNVKIYTYALARLCSA